MKTRAALLMLAPAGIFYLLSFLLPMILVGRLSFYRADFAAETFVGIGNYITALSDVYFLKSFENAFWFVLIITPLIVAGAYKIASFLSGFPERVQSAARFVIYIPGLASGIIITLLWGWFLLRQGLFNQLLALLSLPPVAWLSQAWPARISVSAIIITSSVGGLVIMFAASMHALPKELRDAARIDGASNRQYKRHIVFPLMLPMVLLAVLLEIVGVMQIWETVYVLTGAGGPEGSTASPVYEIFLTAFRYGKPGLAAAKGIILMAVIAIMLGIKGRIEKWAR